ncbi:WXG100 family type VII secretion target [Mycolicibacterium pulveris]|uniref:WXG100 family type VII secretion target n=1 Tax=Mycolicibacterium pulveris TaxID=36813 RepID=UPI003CEE5CD3
MRELKVDPSEVRRSGVEIGEVAAAVGSAFTNSDTQIASAQTGWMGRSASALASIAAEWQEATKALTEILIEHGDKFAAAAKQYGLVDEDEADSVQQAAEKL